MTARTLPTMPTWTAGQEITSSQLNQITAYTQFWANRPMFRMYQSVSTNVPTGAWTQIPMDVWSWDSDSGRSAASPYNYVIPFAGRWRFTWRVAWASNATGIRFGALYQNGNPVQGGKEGDDAFAATATDLSTDSVTVLCSVGDTIGVYGYQDSGSSVATNTSASAESSFFEGSFESLGNP